MNEDQQIRLGDPGVECDFARSSAADAGQTVGILGIVVGEQAIGVEGAKDALANDVLQLVGRHPTVQAVCTHQGDIVNPARSSAGQNGLDHLAADIRSLHLRRRCADVIEGDGQLHRWLQPGQQRC
jgi:hypothetical protein